MLELELISNYLIENEFASTENDAMNIIAAMSDSWLEDILTEELLNEKRRFKAVKDPQTGELKKVKQEKTPLTTPRAPDPKVILKTPSEWRRSKDVEPRDVIHPKAHMGLVKQGIHRGTRPDLVRKGLVAPPPEQHHFAFSDYGPHGHGPGGSKRGVKKVKGEKDRAVIKKVGAPKHWRKTEKETPVSKFKKYKATKSELESRWSSPSTSQHERESILSSLKHVGSVNPLERLRRRREARLKNK